MDGQAQIILERHIVEVYQETGWTTARIGTMFRRTDRSIAGILKKNGIAPPKPGRRTKGVMASHHAEATSAVGSERGGRA